MLNHTQIGAFLQSCISAFDEYIIYAFVLMISFTILSGVRRLLVWGS